VKERQDWKRILPGLAISLIALAAVFYFADLSQVIAALRLADYRLVFLVVLSTLGWLSVRAILWRTLLLEQATTRQTFLTVNEGYLINNVLPLRLGEVARAFLLSRKAPPGFLQVFSTIIIERALDLLMAVGLLLSTLPFVVNASWAMQAAIGAGGLVLAGLVVLYLLAHYPDWVVEQFEKITKRWPAIGRVGGEQLGVFLSGLSVLTDGKRFLRAIFWLILNWSVALFQYYVLLRAFYPGAPLLWAAFSLGVVPLGAAAPSSPGALGVLEASMVAALSVFGLDASTALAVAITGHAINYAVTGIIGIYALVLDGVQLSRVGDFYKQLRDIKPEENI
jgi:uncharacterized protein (TIRG00374 family)